MKSLLCQKYNNFAYNINKDMYSFAFGTQIIVFMTINGKFTNRDKRIEVKLE